jgi:hypothetical protein
MIKATNKSGAGESISYLKEEANMIPTHILI